MTLQTENHTTPFDFSQFALNGRSSAMKKQMMEDKFILDGIAILGQWTVIYAPPNAGKTLITLRMLIDSINIGVIEPSDIYYINADDNYNGFTEKLEIAEKHNFHMLKPGENGFDLNKFSKYLKDIAATGNAKGKIIILDTLKKFVNTMDKSLSTEFGNNIREFVGKGGSVIALAHVNKHTDESGKSIHSGTSDIKDDCDCCFLMDVIKSDGIYKIVEFRNEKSRGNVASKKAVQYLNKDVRSYSELISSVQFITKEKVAAIREHTLMYGSLTSNMKVIECIREKVSTGINQKTELIEAVSESLTISKPRVKEILERHTGSDLSSGHRWTVSKSGKNAHTYQLIPLIRD